MKKNVIFVSCTLVVVLALGVVIALAQKIRSAGRITVTPTPTPFGGIAETVAETGENGEETPEKGSETRTETAEKEDQKENNPTEEPERTVTEEIVTESPAETEEPEPENPTEEPETGGTAALPTETPIPEAGSNRAVEVLKSVSADELKLSSGIESYDTDIDDWTTMVRGVECFCINVLNKEGGLAGIFYVSTDYKRAFRLVDDDEYEELTLN